MPDSSRDTVPVSGDRLLDAVLDGAASLIAVVSAEGELVRWNRACERISGCSAGEIRREGALFDLIPEDERDAAREALARLRGGESPVQIELHWRSRHGELRLIRWTSTALTGADGDVTHVVATGIDVTDARRAQAELEQSRRDFSSLVDSLQEVVFRTDADGRWTFLNSHWAEMSGYSVEQSIGRPFLDFIHADDREEGAIRFARLVAGERQTGRVVQRCLHADGSVRWVEVTIRSVLDDAGEMAGSSGTLTDVTERRQLEERLRHLADHDALTGLINRRRFEEELERHVSRGRRYGMSGALLLLDLDDFKTVNDSHGHRAGDRVLVAVANLLARRLRETDVVARLGGDEFAVLLPLSNAPEAERVCQALERALPEEVAAPGGRRIEASIGFAPFTEATASIDDVLSAADAAMYAVKQGQPRNYRRLRPID